MTARENIRTKLLKLRQQSRETGQVRLSAPATALGLEAGICFLLAAVLAGAVLLEECAPFGIAMVGAAGPGLCGICALAGACFGYLCLLPFSQGACHVAAAILTYAAAFAFYDVKVFRRPWVMPAITGAVTAGTGWLILVQSGGGARDGIRLCLETVMAGGCAWCFRPVLQPAGRRRADRLAAPSRRAGLLVMAAALLTALAPLEVLEGISLGRSLAVLLLLCLAWKGGGSVGAAAGSVLGGMMDLNAGGVPLFTMAYALSGLAAGLCRGRPRVLAAVTYVLADGFAVLWTWRQGMPMPILYETFVSSVLFLLVPDRPLRRLGVWLAPDTAGPADVQAQILVRRKLEATAQAFRTLGDSLRTAFRPPRNDSDISTVFDRTANRVCRACSLRSRCWKEEYNSTFNALNDATQAMVERGRAQSQDFPRHFADRCLHFSSFLGTVNEELTALFYRRQYNARVRESRAAVCRQYAQLSDLLGSAAEELSRELVPEPVSGRRVRARMAELGLDVRTAVFRDSRGLLRLEATGPAAEVLTRPSRISDLSLVLGVPLRVEQEGDGCVALLQQEPLMAVAGVAARRKTGETVSGDAGTYFKRPDGKLYVLLCDGMGSGPEANRESSLAVRLMEQLLQAGILARQALTTLSSALALRGEENGGFSTVDLLQVDLFTGEAELYKMGAAPTYVRKGGAVQRLTGGSLPAGLAEGESGALDRFQLRLRPGDTVLMVSDGVCGTGEDGWLRERLEKFTGESPKDLARELLTQAPQEATDDRTALVIRVEKRK